MSFMSEIKFHDKKLLPIWEKIQAGERLALEDGVTMLQSDDLLALGKMAHAVQREKSGDAVYFVVNRQVNPTNICVLSCKFCDFAVKMKDERAYAMTMEQVLGKLNHDLHEVHIVGGLHPDWPWEFYLDMMRQIKANFPKIDIKAWTAVEIDFFSKKFKLSIHEVLRQLKEAGLCTMPGGGAEVFSERVRRRLFNQKIGEKRWREVHRAAHELGIPTNATMLYGHIETLEERVMHLIKMREQQDESHGFLTFIPLAYQPGNNGVVDRYTSAVDDLKTIAVSRLMLDNFPHIKAYWIMLTAEVAPIALHFGADDMDGTVGEERIAHAAHATSPVTLAKEHIINLIRSGGKIPVERDILYNPIAVHAPHAIGKIPYLNCVPFYREFEPVRVKQVPMSPNQMGRLAQHKFIEGGPLSLMDYFRVEKDYEMLNYGIAVKNLARSVILYSNFKWRELEGKHIGVTAYTSTSIELLRVILQHKYGVRAKLERLHTVFQAQEAGHFDAALVIGDEALRRAQSGLAGFQHVYDLGHEWHEWTGLPFVFAVWAIQREVEQQHRRELITELERAAVSADQRHPGLGQTHGKRLGLTQAEVHAYFDGFLYRLGAREHEAIQKFREYVTEHEPNVLPIR
ncbi:aminofutalosine synthase MqnE [candidate division KSB1 bacterium]|nr:aminofutalosine synthase MqnE [candidate division KSB1 bacterium]